MTHMPNVAYFTMEIGLTPAMPTYSGGLGVLAGDTIRSAADLQIPTVAVSLLYHKGYFQQSITEHGQVEKPVEWRPEEFLEPLNQRVQVEIEGRHVVLTAWRYRVRGVTGHEVPVIFLDANLKENAPQDQALSNQLYGGDEKYRLSQEIILGIGGVRMLRALGYRFIDKFHMNEGHASLLTLELINEQLAATQAPQITPDILNAVRKQCVFTTHTPVPAGHDCFSAELAQRILNPRHWQIAQSCGQTEQLHTTHLALRCSGYTNGVAMKHGEVSREMFPGFNIQAITNGVHAVYWTMPSFQRLFDKWIPAWRQDNEFLRHAIGIPTDEIWAAHQEAKQALCDVVNQNAANQDKFEVDRFTLGFARRSTAYKRATLLFKDLDRVREISKKFGKIQIVFAGKAHPRDEQGKQIISEILKAQRELKNDVAIAFVENYNMESGKLITCGVDVWLNNPRPPLEASGTSGMKSALNGVPSLSVLDGWWIEGHMENITGWGIGEDAPQTKSDDEQDAFHAAALYTKLEKSVLPAFYEHRQKFREIMRNSIAMNGSYFNTQRMMAQYLQNAYRA